MYFYTISDLEMLECFIKLHIVKDKRDEILNEKLLTLFKAIYSKDSELDKITKDAFE